MVSAWRFLIVQGVARDRVPEISEAPAQAPEGLRVLHSFFDEDSVNTVAGFQP
jgi:hypothetical protein